MRNDKNNKLKPKIINRGFTLIETLVAITILSAAITGPLILAIKNIGTAAVSQDQLVAFYLGQEIIEYVRNVRDTNIIKQINWLDGLDSCKSADGSLSCYIDVANANVNGISAISSCDVSGCPKLKFNDISKQYNYQSVSNGNKETVFTRTVKIENPISGNVDEAKINVYVKWTGKYGEKTMNLQDNIFNWR